MTGDHEQLSGLTQVSFNGGFGSINIDQTAAMGVAMYTIRIPIGGVIYEVVVGYDSATGTFKIVSCKIVE